MTDNVPIPPPSPTPPKTTEEIYTLRFKLTRDLLLFFVGLAGVAHETLLTTTERPALLILFSAMMGLPAFLRADEKRSEK